MQPGQAVALQVAILPHRRPWKMMFFCHNLVVTFPQALKNVVFQVPGRPGQPPKYEIQTEWVRP